MQQEMVSQPNIEYDRQPLIIRSIDLIITEAHLRVQLGTHAVDHGPTLEKWNLKQSKKEQLTNDSH